MFRTGYHKCDKMPHHEFIEKEQTYWHIHNRNLSPAEYRVNLKDGICPYCKEELKDMRGDEGNVNFLRF